MPSYICGNSEFSVNIMFQILNLQCQFEKIASLSTSANTGKLNRPWKNYFEIR